VEWEDQGTALVYFSDLEIYFTKFWCFFLISQLASNFRAAGLGKGMLDWLGKVRLGESF